MGHTTPYTTDIFTEKAIEVHGHKYDYSKVEYKNSKVKVTIVCPRHGEFDQRPSHHLRGVDCPVCAIDKLAKSNSHTTKQFIKRATKVHGNKYDYSKVRYERSGVKVCIICPIHGEFKQTPGSHVNNRVGCDQCGMARTIEFNSHDTKQFIEKAMKIHGDKYDYSEVEYKNIISKVTIVCPEHGEFKQRAASHLKGQKCKKCVIQAAKCDTEEFIKRATKVHGNKYDYSKVICDGVENDVIIICPEHGEFKQRPSGHIGKRKNGCPSCALRRDQLKDTTEQFIRKATSVHKNRYDYSKTEYNKSADKVAVMCPKHGKFKQRANHHLQGHGCSLCPAVISAGHQEVIDYITSITNIELLINDRKAIAPKELDIYIPEKNLAIEYNGLYYHSYGRQETTEERQKHKIKHQLCADNGIKLYQISENEWMDTRTRKIIKSKINVTLGSGRRVFARKCKIKELDNKEYKEFIGEYHMQGYKGASVRIGLFYQGELLSVMSFNKHPKYEWEINRFANKLDVVVVGGASKIFKYFVNKYKPNQMLTYADKRYSDGNLYRKMGFDLEGVTSPNYVYIKDGKIHSRQQFQKHKLSAKLDTFDPNLTESENMFNNEYRRLWDAGHYRFTKTLNG